MTTILFGSTMPLVQRYLVPPKPEEATEYDGVAEGAEGGAADDTQESEKARAGSKEEKKNGEMKINNSNEKEDKKNVRHSEYEEFLHPNAIRDSEYETAEKRKISRSEFKKIRAKRFNSCAACFKRFDDLIMRPWLIYKYENELVAKKDEFMQLFMKEAEEWEKIYLNEEYNE